MWGDDSAFLLHRQVVLEILMEIFCERFKMLKMQKNLTYPQIAEYLGLKLRVVKSYASGEAKPGYYGLLKIADLFNVSLDYLVGRSDDPEVRR
jgi:transcriptional regulator with XRE-family HTH domain